MTILKMKWRRFALAALLFPNLLLPVVLAAADNRVADLYFYEKGREVGIIFKAEEPPAYSVQSKAGESLLVLMGNTDMSDRALQRTKKNGWPLQITRENERDLKCVVNSPGEVRRLRTTWAADKGLLFIQFFLKKPGRAAFREGRVGPSLKRLRFGVKKISTRAVLVFDRKPRWFFSFGPEEGFNLGVADGKTGIEKRAYGPIPRLGRVGIRTLPDALTLVMASDGQEYRTSVFWMDDGNRLVMDLFDASALPDFKGPALPPDFGKAQPKPPLDKKRVESTKPAGAEGGRADAERAEPKPPLDAKRVESTKSVRAEGRHADAKRMEAAQKGRKDSAVSAASESIPVSEKAFEGTPKPVRAVGEGPFLRRAIKLRPEKRTSGVPTKVKNPGGERASEKVPRSSITQDRRQWLPIHLKAEAGHTLDPEEAISYGKIWKASELKRFKEATRLIDQFLARFPLSIVSEKLAFLKGDMLFSRFEEGERDLLHQVVEAYRKAIGRSKDADKVTYAYIRMAKAHRLTGDDIGALSYLDLAVRHCEGCPKGAEAYMERGVMLMKTGSPEKATLDFREVLARYPNSPLAASALFGIAQYLHGKGLYQNAEAKLEQIAHLDHDFRLKNPDFLPLQAQNRLYLKDYGGARELFFKALNLDPRSEGKDLLLSHIGDTFLYQFRPKEAEKMYRQTVKDYPNSEGATIAELRLAELYFDVEGLKESRGQQSGGLTGEVTNLKIANAYFNGGQYKMAMDGLKELASKPPQDPVIAAARELFRQSAEKKMTALYGNREFSELVELFKANESLLKDRIDPDIQLLVAMSLQELKKFPAAVTAYEALNPKDVSLKMKGRYYLGLARCYAKAGDSEAIVVLMEDARKSKLSEKDRQRVTHFLADLYKSEKEYGKAYALFTELMRSKLDLSSGEMAQIYLALGEILNKLEKYQKAKEYLYRSIALSERERNAKKLLFPGQGSLGDSFLGRGKYGEALIHYQKAFEMESVKTLPQYWDFKLGQAEALMAQKNRSLSDRLLDEVYEGKGPGPRLWELKYRLAKSYLEAGSPEKAEVLLKQISEEGTQGLQSEAQLLLGSVAMERKLKKLSIWPEIAGQGAGHAGP